MTPARERLVAVLALLAVGGAIVLVATRPFATVTIAGLAKPIVVAGQQAAPALAPLGLVVLALAGALTIAGPIARIALGALLLLDGTGVVALALPSALDPAAGTGGAVTKATGLADLVLPPGAVVGTPWPWVGVVAGVAAALLGLAVLLRTRRWSTGGRRFRRAAPVGPTTDPIAEWDALTRGSDPTDDLTS